MSMLAITSLASCNIESPTSRSKSEQDSQDSADSSSASSSSSDISGEAELISISLNKTSTSIMLDSSETLTVTFNPADAKDKTVIWASDDATVASVNNGVVTANKVGSTTIRVTSQVNSAITASCQVTVTDNVVLSNVDAKHEFVLFNTNKSKDPNSNDGFYDRTQTFKVGDDNAFNVKPELTVLDAETYLPVSVSKWTHDFQITATMDGQDAGSQYFSVVDARNCDVKFTQEAVGHNFVISVVPTGILPSQVSRFTRTVTVEVVDGYNVYDAKELGYFDTRYADSREDSFTLEDDTVWPCKWTEFKAANGMDINYHPAALILQKDIKVTTADLPSNFFYTQAEATAIGDASAAGSLHDWAYLYMHTTDDSVTVDGNYFELDLSDIPLVKRESHKPTAVGAVVSHAAAFKAIRGNDVKFQNINMTGNAKNAADDADKIYGGGFIFVKGAGSKTFTASNIIATKFFITFMGEKQHYEDSPNTSFILNNMKCFNNYNSFLYNWGSEMNIKNSLLTNCGGPIIIQDHTSTDQYEDQNGMVVLGRAPTTTFEDCSLVNYVAGSEAWFQQFNATALVPKIKGMSDLLGATGLPKSFVVNEAKEGKFYQALASQASFFNFVAINKSGSAQGLTSSPNCGTVNIIESGKTTSFNYRQPANDPVAQAYIAFLTAADADKQAAQQTLIATAMQNGVTFAADFSDANQKINEYLTTLCTPHGILRELNNAGAPVFDLGGAFDLIGYDGANSYLQALTTIAAEMEGGSPAIYPATNEQKAAMPNYCGVYYNGMLLVFGLTPYVA